MRLIDDIRQQVAVADDGFPCGQGGPNHFFDKLRRAVMYNSISARRWMGVS